MMISDPGGAPSNAWAFRLFVLAVLGFMLGSGVFSGGDSVPMSRFAALGVEVEVAFLLKRDLAGPGVTPVSALLAVEGAMPSFELIDFRFSGRPTGADVVADGVYTNAIVLGRPLTPVAALDLALEGVVYEQNGQTVATATAAEVLGNPLISLAWVANTLGRMGRGLVLQRLLDKDVLFPDPEFRTRLEAQARKNMTAEIASLAEG